jgi:hypothetical protein
MKQLVSCALLVSALLAACAGDQTQLSSADSRALEPCFNDWKNAVVSADFDYVYNHTSVTMKARWLYNLYIPVQTKDGPRYSEYAADCVRKLPKELGDEFEHWLRFNRQNEGPESLVSALPATLAKSDWLKETLRGHFMSEYSTLKHEFAAKVFREAYVEADAATITVLNIRQESEMYEMVKEDDVWKMNYWKPSPPKR